MALHDGHGPLRCHPGCPAHAEFMAEMHDQMRPTAARSDANVEHQQKPLTGTLCDGCNVREPFEHRCHGLPCPCEECREADRLFGTPAVEEAIQVHDASNPRCVRRRPEHPVTQCVADVTCRACLARISFATPPPDDWPIADLLRARAGLQVWARERGILPSDHMLVIEVRGRRRGDDNAPFGVMPRDSAIVVHHNGDEWT